MEATRSNEMCKRLVAVNIRSLICLNFCPANMVEDHVRATKISQRIQASGSAKRNMDLTWVYIQNALFAVCR